MKRVYCLALIISVFSSSFCFTARRGRRIKGSAHTFGFTKNKTSKKKKHQQSSKSRSRKAQSKNFRCKESLYKPKFKEGLKENDVSKIQVALSLGSDKNQRGKFGRTPLHKAAHYGSADVASFLIEKGVWKNLRNDFGNTALHLACKKGHLDVVKSLVEGEVLLKLKNHKRETPLQSARRKKKTEVVKYLESLSSVN